MICNAFKEKFISPGRVSLSRLNQHHELFTNVCQKINGNDAPIEMIGHGAGSWRYYPMEVNKQGLVYGNGFTCNKSPAKNINELIDLSVQNHPQMAIELDAHLAPEGHVIKTKKPENNAYILHNIPEWETKKLNKIQSLEYLKQNTIQSSFQHIIDNNYHQQCKTYTEIKVPKEFYKPKNYKLLKEQCEILAREFGAFSGSHTRTDQQNWVCITSFSTQALTYFYDELKKMKLEKTVDYVLILGYTGFINSIFASLKGFVPAFTTSTQGFLSTTPWINKAWFSLQGIRNYHEIFNTIEEKRKVKSLSPISYSFSTYQFSEENLSKKLLCNQDPKYKFGSFMIDLDF